MASLDQLPSGSQRPAAVVTGASAGIGRATAIELAARGFDLGLIARDPDGLDEVAGTVERLGRRAALRRGRRRRPRGRRRPGGGAVRRHRRLGELGDGDDLRAGRRHNAR